jgi:hypothetical protein
MVYIHQEVVCTSVVRVPRKSGYPGLVPVPGTWNLPEPSANPRTGQELEPRVPIFELTTNYPAPPSFTLNYLEPKPKGGSFTRNKTGIGGSFFENLVSVKFLGLGLETRI